MRRINYKSDIPPLLLSLKVDEKQITVPECDFIVRFYIEGYEGRHYDCSHIGGVWSNCETSEDGTKLVCYINNQRLGIGELCAEFHYISPDRRYSDGSQKSVVIIDSTELGVELVEDNGDAVTEAAIDVTLPFIYRTAYEIARDHGYTGTAEDFYSALASVVAIADAEKKRVTAEITRNANEQERIENEENRLNAESERVNAEAQRVRNEAIRGDAESVRVEQEEDRKAKFVEITGFIATVRANEGNRESNELERQTNEDTRITEEAKRVEAEKKRAAEFEQQKLDLTGKIDRSGDEMGGDLIFTDNAGVSFRTSDGGAHTMFNGTDDVAKFTADNGDTFEFKQNETPNKNSSAVVVGANLYNALDMTLDSMGSALDGDAAYRAEAGDKIFNPDTCKIQRYNSTIGGFEDLCDPIDGKLYANKMTDYIYRWNTEAKKMVFVGGVKAYTKDEADSRFAKIDDATQRVKAKDLEANNSVTAKSMWIGDEGLLLGGDGNGHLTVEQDEVITDVTLNKKLATKADDVAYGVEWNNGQPTGDIQETTVKDATKNTTVTTLLLAQSYNVLEQEVGKKVDKTDITQSTGTSETSVMSQKAVTYELSEVGGKVEDLLPMSRLYKSFLTMAGETKAGAVYVNNSFFAPNDSVGENLVFQVTAGVTYLISLTVARVAPTFGCVSFISGGSFPTSNVLVDEIIKACDALGAYETTYTPASNGYIIIFQKYNDVVYSSGTTVKYPQYIDFKSKIDATNERIDDVEDGIASVENYVAGMRDAFEHNQALTDKSDYFTVDMWAYINGTTGLISEQPESTGRRVIAYKATAGQKYRIISSILLNNTVYTFLAFFPGQTAPVTGNYATVIKKYNGTNTDITLPIEQDGWIMIGFISTQVFMRTAMDWRLYLYDIINTGAKLSLPEKVNGVVGDTLQVFRRSIVDAIDPYSFDLSVKCDNGKIYRRYYEFTPSSAGTVRLNAQLKNNVGQILDEGYMDIIVSPAPSSPLSMKRIAIFGDSLTQNGEYVKEVVRRLLSSDAEKPDFPAGKGLSNIKFIGAMGEGNARYYGVGGWDWKNYATEGSPAFRFQVTGVTTIVKGTVYSNNGHQYTVMENNTTNGVGNILCSTSASMNVPQVSGILTKVSGGGDANITFTSVMADQQNPLWDADNQEISFAKYLNNIGETTVDCVYFLLGWNGFYYDYPGSAERSGVYIRNILDALHTQFPSAIVRILGLQLPSLNGGLGANYGASGKYSDLYWLIKQVREYNAFLASVAVESVYSEFVEFVDVASQFDSENNMLESETMVNTRNTSKMEWRGTNGVHPANTGYMQIADVVYRKVVNDFC